MQPIDLKAAMQALAAADPALATVIAEVGTPPSRQRPANFATLLQIIIGQQVSVAAAAAIWGQVTAAGISTPQHILDSDDQSLRDIGFSRPKIRYARSLADAIASGQLCLSALTTAPTDEVQKKLTAVPGIGRWSAEIFCLFALNHGDIWPAGDVALQEIVRQVKALPNRPSVNDMDLIAEAWRPWRGAAAILLWHYYRITVLR
jgi:DNA-3-methyladenine glycosylase II